MEGASLPTEARLGLETDVLSSHEEWRAHRPWRTALSRMRLGAVHSRCDVIRIAIRDGLKGTAVAELLR